ncbi:double-strand break repair helicase AddA [Bradyrhizobium sp.]|uniref:double-strand break repair helicase AddA n=1 Tax=Bradyrhizobium sp. TaxID=376 RepID=UPI003C385111
MVKAIRPIPPAVRDKQASASNPTASSFVSANAGSGKTHVLVQRVIRLLLTGVAPEKILCITFTKAAAANMAERVFATLGHWVTLDDAELDNAIRDTGVPNPNAKLRKLARELFAKALETPGGLKVQTIHALCTRLLQQFPFEANVPARFAVLDERDQADMMERANLRVFLEASNAPDSVLGRALQTAMANAADVTFKDVVREACLSRDHFMAWTDTAGSAEIAAAEMSAVLGVSTNDSLDDVERDIVDGPYLPRVRWREIAGALDGGSKSDQNQGEQLRASLGFTGSTQVDEYLCIFLTDNKSPRAAVLTRAFVRDNPSVARLFDAEILRLAPLIEKRRAVITRDRTEALLHIAMAAAANYRREKQERGLLDYDDLIDKTLAMLSKVSAGWVHYKLDRGVDHILIDEAQDTSPRQWDIVEHIISEFAAGHGARDGVTRTMFAVGDEKQSIFSFQGAAPLEFAERRARFGSRFKAAELDFESISFTYSFRSGAGVLRAVESAFQSPDVYRSITTDQDGMPTHEALDDAGPSLIELWPLAQADDREDIEGWRAPFDGVSVASPEVKLSRRIQAEIKRLVTSGTMTGPKGERRPLRYGDVLVLVRRRGNIFDAVIQALKHASVPVAGADRLKLTEHIAIIDLMNLADALLLPLDDLALAVALKSPLFGLDEDDLFKLAWDRKGSLREALSKQAATKASFQEALGRLQECERRFTQTPFAFYAWLLGGDGGRQRILRRLGSEANDALDEFLELALNYERKAPASLQGFMAWLRSADTEVKRDMEISRDEVRVMTVHGAKGLEASVVIMVDTTSSPSDTQRLRLIQVPRGNGGEVTVWAGKKADDPSAVAAARTAMLNDTEDEYRRLLYVAMTRTADRLIVAGIKPGNMNSVRKHSWYDLVDKGLAASGLHEEIVETDDGKIKRYMRPEDSTQAGGAVPEATGAQLVLPAWLRTSLPAPTTTSDLLRPSDPSEARRVRSGESVGQRTQALRRGTLVHRLLQSLPDVAAERRRDAALNFLRRNAGDWTDGDRDTLTTKVLGLVSDQPFAAVFADGSRAEVPIVGRLERLGGASVLVSGQIDRLVVTETEALIVDFKTNLSPPGLASEAPAAYVRQLALYRALLQKLYPQRAIRAALLWTEIPELMEILAPALDAELASITAGTSKLDPATTRS